MVWRPSERISTTRRATTGCCSFCSSRSRCFLSSSSLISRKKMAPPPPGRTPLSGRPRDPVERSLHVRRHLAANALVPVRGLQRPPERVQLEHGQRSLVPVRRHPVIPDCRRLRRGIASDRARRLAQVLLGG